MPYLIDGHNVIAALPDIDLEDEHDEAKLVLKLRAWTGREQRKAIVVFDGGIPGGYARALSSIDVKVVFAARHYTNADRIIRERLEKLPDAPNWTVVSSDYEVLDHARQIGARVMTAQEFADRLSLTPEAGKDKPDTISAAEVAEWLQIFPEIEETSAPLPIPVSATRKKSSVSSPSPRPKSRPKQVEEPRGRTTSSIGTQIGQEPKPSPKPARVMPQGEKPEEISEEELAEWLQVFHDLPESHIPPPKIPRREPKPRKKTELTVDKDTEGLSSEEVDEWLALFGGEPAPATPKPAQPTPEKTKTAGRRSQASRRWSKHKHKQAPVEQPGTATDLSPEDLDLWRRLYGKGE